jgi:hypothetical protein
MQYLQTKKVAHVPTFQCNISCKMPIGKWIHILSFSSSTCWRTSLLSFTFTSSILYLYSGVSLEARLLLPRSRVIAGWSMASPKKHAGRKMATYGSWANQHSFVSQGTYLDRATNPMFMKWMRESENHPAIHKLFNSFANFFPILFNELNNIANFARNVVPFYVFQSGLHGESKFLSLVILNCLFRLAGQR